MALGGLGILSLASDMKVIATKVAETSNKKAKLWPCCIFLLLNVYSYDLLSSICVLLQMGRPDVKSLDSGPSSYACWSSLLLSFPFFMFTGLSKRLLSSSWGHGSLLIFWTILLGVLNESWLVCFVFFTVISLQMVGGLMKCFSEPEKFQSIGKIAEILLLWSLHGNFRKITVLIPQVSLCSTRTQSIE